MFCRILNQYSTCFKVLLEFHLKFLAPLNLQLSAKFGTEKKKQLRKQRFSVILNPVVILKGQGDIKRSDGISYSMIG